MTHKEKRERRRVLRKFLEAGVRAEYCGTWTGNNPPPSGSVTLRGENLVYEGNAYGQDYATAIYNVVCAARKGLEKKGIGRPNPSTFGELCAIVGL